MLQTNPKSFKTGFHKIHQSQGQWTYLQSPVKQCRYIRVWRVEVKIRRNYSMLHGKNNLCYTSQSWRRLRVAHIRLNRPNQKWGRTWGSAWTEDIGYRVQLFRITSLCACAMSFNVWYFCGVDLGFSINLFKQGFLDSSTWICYAYEWEYADTWYR